MADCSECHVIAKSHEEMIGDLTIVRSLDEFLKARDLVKAEKTIDILWKRLRERHQEHMGR